MRAVLQFASEERSADEHPDERRQENQVPRDVDAASELTLEVAHDDVAARARGRRQAGGERFPLVGGPHRQPGDQCGERETDDQCEADEQLVAMLPPGHPCHRSRPFSGCRRAGQPLGRHVGEQQVLEPDLVDRPRGVDDAAVEPCEQRHLAAAVALPDDLLDAGDPAERPGRAGQEPVRRDQLLDAALEPDMSLAQEDDVVGDALDVRDHVRGDHHGGLQLGDTVHQQLEELTCRERVEPRERLVEEQQGRALPERHRESEARPFTRRQRGDAVVCGQTRQELARDRLVPAADSSRARTRSCRAP